jgi:hypothetical protein
MPEGRTTVIIDTSGGQAWDRFPAAGVSEHRAKSRISGADVYPPPFAADSSSSSSSSLSDSVLASG